MAYPSDTNWGVLMSDAAADGNIELMSLCREKLGNDSITSWAMAMAAHNGHIGCMQQCYAWGARKAEDIGRAMAMAAFNDHLECMRLCRKWGATDVE